MKLLGLSLATFVLLLAGCVNESGEPKTSHEIHVDAFSNFWQFFKNNAAVINGDTVTVHLSWDSTGQYTNYTLHDTSYDLTAALPAYVVDTSAAVNGNAGIDYKNTFYVAGSQPSPGISCTLDNLGKKFVEDSVYSAGTVFQLRHSGATSYYRLVDAPHVVGQYACEFHQGKGIFFPLSFGFPPYGEITIHY